MRSSDIHAPDSVRVNAALSQMQEFANTFLSEPIPSHPSLTLHLLTCPHPPQLPRGVAHEPPLEQVQGVVRAPPPLHKCRLR